MSKNKISIEITADGWKTDVTIIGNIHDNPELLKEAYDDE